MHRIPRVRCRGIGLLLFYFLKIDIGAFVFPDFFPGPPGGVPWFVRGVPFFAGTGAARAACGAPDASDGGHEECKEGEDDSKEATEGFHFLFCFFEMMLLPGIVQKACRNGLCLVFAYSGCQREEHVEHYDERQAAPPEGTDKKAGQEEEDVAQAVAAPTEMFEL